MMRTLVSLAVLSVLACSASAQVNQEMIDRVAAGEVTEARASWWGFDAEDSTGALQAAINSGAEKLIVEDMGAPWIVTPIQLASNQEVVFEEGCEILAKRGEFKAGGAALVRARNVENVILRGEGATFRMWREDYANPELYAKAEWRHCLNIAGATNLQVHGLTLTESGGDGIYLGVGEGGRTNRDIVISGVTCDRNYRQGISVISAENLLIEDTVLSSTHGTWPQAGIDFEPNDPNERLVNVVMRDCLSESNTYGYVINITPHNAPAENVSIRFERCRAIGNAGPGFAIQVARDTPAADPLWVLDVDMKGCLSEANSGSGYLLKLSGDDAAAVHLTRCRSVDDGASGAQIVSSMPGAITFTDCLFDGSGSSGISVSTPADGSLLLFRNCRVLDCAAQQPEIAPIMFASGGAMQAVGGVRFADVLVRDPVQRPPLGYNDRAGGTPVRNVVGTLTVERDGERSRVDLTDDLIADWLPPTIMREISRLSLEAVALEPMTGDLPPPAASPSPWPQVRGTGEYVLHAESGDEVLFAVRYLQVGPYAGRQMPVTIVGPSGNEVHAQSAAFKADTTISFTAPETGLYQFTLSARNNRARIVNPSHPTALVMEGGPAKLSQSAGSFIFYVPPGTAEFGMRVAGQGTGEGVRATLIDPQGEVFGQVDNQFGQYQFEVDLAPPSEGEVWTLRLDRPSDLTWDDHSVELRGVPPLLSAAGTVPLTPAPPPE